ERECYSTPISAAQHVRNPHGMGTSCTSLSGAENCKPLIYLRETGNGACMAHGALIGNTSTISNACGGPKKFRQHARLTTAAATQGCNLCFFSQRLRAKKATPFPAIRAVLAYNLRASRPRAFSRDGPLAGLPRAAGSSSAGRRGRQAWTPGWLVA